MFFETHRILSHARETPRSENIHTLRIFNVQFSSWAKSGFGISNGVRHHPATSIVLDKRVALQYGSNWTRVRIHFMANEGSPNWLLEAIKHLFGDPAFFDAPTYVETYHEYGTS